MTDPKKTMTGLYIAAGIVLFLAIVVGAYRFGTHKSAPPGENSAVENVDANTEIVPPAGNTQAAHVEEATNAPAHTVKTDGTEGREEAALAAAIIYQPDLSYRVDGHARDWSEVSIYAGRKEGSWTKILSFRWDGGQYTFVDEKPFPGSETKPAKKPVAKKPQPSGDQPLTEDDLRSIPKEFRPGESTAVNVALGDHENWVGKVQRHSGDWATAVVAIGPPDSEAVSELQLKWSRKGQYYEVVQTKDIPPAG